ncbi:Otoferlin [Amphibalanus amphitrite]|uniref:Otoferlin n=1 Tax=Amphibalanus amphitrite TaxID=1232801 RepID=A0A6A4VGG8_AMPAM|nr:Otoferlin [Amphibalanus amphitrite]
MVREVEFGLDQPLDRDALLTLEVVARNRYLQNRSLGGYGLVLQRVLDDGGVRVNDYLVDSNNKIIQARVRFEVVYRWPGEASLVSWPSMTATVEDDQQMLVDIEQNIANLERSFCDRSSFGGSPTMGNAADPASPTPSRKRAHMAMRRVKSLMRLGRRRTSIEDELLPRGDGGELSGAGSQQSLTEQLPPRPASVCSQASDDSTMSATAATARVRRRRDTLMRPPATLRAEDYQVCVTVIEARQLAGLNMDPVVCVQVGEQKKYTSVKESTNCPYYNEYFVFDFHMAPTMLFDKIITLTGYLKCDISVIGKGDTVKAPTRTDRDEDDIEANLLLPDGVTAERQRARISVTIHSADGLPRMNSSLMANVKRALTGENSDLVNPYVRVSFAGLTGRTSVKKSCYSPHWNQQIVFTEMFPPLCQRIKIQLKDMDTVNDTLIGTHFLDLNTISNDGERGFLPTFGPAYVHMYGSTRDYMFPGFDEHSPLNNGLGEGISYRAQLLVSVRTEVTDVVEPAPSEVEVEPAPAMIESQLGKPEEFFLFASILEATMIPRRLGEKPIHFELSIGNHGNTMDGHNTTTRRERTDDDPGLESVLADTPPYQSTSHPIKPMSYDRLYYFLPYWDNKPCLHVRSVWHDHRRRLYHSNLLARIAEKLDLSEEEDPSADQCLKACLDQLCADCARYVSVMRCSSQPVTGRTKLDKERVQWCLQELESMGDNARRLRLLVTPANVKEKLRTAHSFLQRLRFLTEDPQHSLPDVFIWMVSGGKRVAYQRLRARSLLHSLVEEEAGQHCGKVQTLFLKTFQLRAHVYQARSLIGSDSSGLSDPFARIVFGEHSRTTQVIDETLSPTWDELLLIDDVTVYGSPEAICREPPTVVIEVFDQDKMGKAEFIGRTMARPHLKLLDEPYERPRFPPPLEWHQLVRGTEAAGDLLAVFELLQVCDDPRGGDIPPPPPAKYRDSSRETGPVMPIPKEIRPTLVKYRIEVLFWGLRALRRIHFLTVDNPRVDVECAGNSLQSSVIQNYRKNPNFPSPVKIMDLELPEEEVYCPPITIRVVDCRSFGRFTLVGTHIISNIHRYMVRPQPAVTASARPSAAGSQLLPQSAQLGGGQPPGGGEYRADGERSPLLQRDTLITIDYGCRNGGAGHRVMAAPAKRKKREKPKQRRRNSQSSDEEEGEGAKDWWTKYFASKEALIESERQNRARLLGIEAVTEVAAAQAPPTRSRKVGFKGASQAVRLAARISPKFRRKNKKSTALLQIYQCELEQVAEFGSFREWLLTFDLYRGKKADDFSDDESRIVGKFKGSLKMYRWPPARDCEALKEHCGDPYKGYFSGLPSNEPIHVLVRVYVVRALDLHPMDLNGKADPYIVLQLGSKKLSDKENYQSKQLNPVFGKCLEVEATFPQDSMLVLQVLDWDLVGTDELIGETRIDLENRFYSRHRATCGLDAKFETSGYNAWRDPMRPTQILHKLCKENKLDGPHYQQGYVRIGNKTLAPPAPEGTGPDAHAEEPSEEDLALAALHQWSEIPRVGCKLTPAHIETRPLYNPEKPGIEQGKLEMWVDMFPMDMPLPPPPVDIAPRKPKSYELRVIIWNTDDVVLEDDAFFTGEKMSDIYVKGWVKGPEDCQCTDIHYRSLTGEGNFNWRFIFPFDYLVAEQKIVISRKESLFSWDESECKIPARLELQVWDADHFSADDFLGQITLDLNRFPRGAKSSKHCTLSLLKNDGSVPMVSIFKQKRVKGWWPFYVKNNNEEMALTGKVEAEIHLLTAEEAERSPVGMGRNEPDPLDKPNRPDSSFMWFMNPIKSIRYIVWHNYKWTIVKILLVLALAILLLLFFYSLPGYSVKKLLGA